MSAIEDLIGDFNKMQDKVVNNLNKVSELSESVNAEVEWLTKEVDGLTEKVSKLNKSKLNKIIEGLDALLELKLPRHEKKKIKELKKDAENLSKGLSMKN